MLNMTTWSQTITSESLYDKLAKMPVEDDDPANKMAQAYLEASFASNIPSFPLSDPFVQAANYKDWMYFGIQHMSRVFQGVQAQLERKSSGKGKPSSGATASDQDYEPFEDHSFVDILREPNPADTLPSFLTQVLINRYLHGRILIWGKPNAAGAPERLYVLPVPLCTPAYNVGSPKYPLGAWRIQQYYPTTGLSGVLPTGLSGMAGAVIDSREIYEWKDPHPIYRWAPYSPQTGTDVQRDLAEMIDRSFWSIMTQGINPAAMLDLPGAKKETIDNVQARIDNQHGGAGKHGKIIVVGGGDVDRPAAKLQPFISQDGTPHGEGWERYGGFVLGACFGLDLAAVGLGQNDTFAGKWAAMKGARDNVYEPFLAMFSDVITRGPVRKWGLTQQGVRARFSIPMPTGYEPDAMSRDLAGDGTGTVDEVRAIRGLKPVKKYGDLPVPVYLKMIEKDLGIDEMTEQQEMAEQDAQIQQDQMTQEAKLNPDNQRPTNDKGQGSLGGEGAGAPKPGATETKAIPETRPLSQETSPVIASLVARILSTPVSLNGKH